MYLEILTPEKDIFKGEVDRIQFPGSADLGSFEILNNHAPLVSSLVAGDLKISGPDGERFFHIKTGFVEVLNNKVAVLVEGAEDKE